MNYVESVRLSIDLTNNGYTCLPQEVFDLPGFSGKKVRTLLNWINKLTNPNYLEIGIWKGSTFISALYGNSFEFALGIDNGSEFGNAEFERNQNTRQLLTDLNRIRFINRDCFELNPYDLGRTFNVYFYDGNHSYDSQVRAFTHYNPVLRSPFIAIVDDYNWLAVENGTKDAFSTLGYKVVDDWELRTNMEGDPDSYWNGLYLAVVEK